MSDVVDAMSPFVRIRGVRITTFGGRGRVSMGLMVAEVALLTLMLVPVYRPFADPLWYWAIAVLCLIVGYWGMRLDMRRLRPRKRALRALWLLALLSLLFLAMTLFFAADAPKHGYNLMVLFAVFTSLAAVAAAAATVRWRRLRAEAEIRLWNLKSQRSKNRLQRS